MRSLWDVIDLQLDEHNTPQLTYGRFDALTGHGYGAVPGGKFSAKGGPVPVNTANQANQQYPYPDPDQFDEDEDEDEDDWSAFLNDQDFRASFLAKTGQPAQIDDPFPAVDKRSFVGNDFLSLSEGPGRSAPYPKQEPMDVVSTPRRLYKNRGPTVGGTAPKMGPQSMGGSRIGSYAGWSFRPPVRFDLDDFVVYRLADMPNDDQRAVMKAAKGPEIVEK
jgi:hypothetical protein